MIRDKHKEFAEHYALTTNVVESYQKVYPKAKDTTARTNGLDLLKKPEIKEFVNQRKEFLSNSRIQEVKDELKDEIKDKLLRREQALDMTANVAKTLYATIVDSGVPPTASQVTAFVSIMDRLAKFDGWDKPSKVAQTDTEGNDIPLFIQMVKKGVKIRYNEN